MFNRQDDAAFLDHSPQDLQVDWDHLHQISDFNTEFELELLQLFADDTQVHLRHIHKAIASGNLTEVIRLAHHIKGSSANVGIQTIHTLAKQLEQLGRQNSGPFNHLLLELEQGVAKLQGWLSNAAGR